MATVQLLPSQTSLPRSSHSLALISDNLYILGGEITPREPANPFLHVYNLKEHTLQSLQNDYSPSPRVGAASVVVDGKIYLWGGRGGKAMTPLNEEGKFWIYDPEKTSWSQSPTPTGDIPEPRSYHTLAAIDDRIYLHAGCPASGRLSTLHVYSISENTWTQLPSAPGSPRGGTSLVAIGSVLLRFGGFNGEELGESIEVFSPLENEWTSRPFISGPGKRSVSNFVPYPLDPTRKAVLLFGEKSPSSDGHNAAGTFWNDVWVYDFENDVWEQAEMDNAHVLTEGGIGWGAAAVDLMGGSMGVIVWGGLNTHNERVGSGWNVHF